MENSRRVFLNTVAQYARTLVNMLLSLYTVRLVLQALGQSDYGLYMLVAGVVSMLSFVTLSLVVTTQRFVSFYQGRGRLDEMRRVFTTSLMLHVLLGIGVAACLELLSPLLFGGFLNIPPGRGEAASFVFQMVVLMLFLSFVTAPFRALLISHEDIVYISAVDVADGVLKVLLAVVLLHLPAERLQFYALMMVSVQLLNFLAFAVFCFVRYAECCLPRRCLLSGKYVRELLSFAGWSIYGTGCIVGRQQGIAVILNRSLGTVVNAAYGIAFQIAGYTNFLSSALSQAMAPQIVKSEGRGDRSRALQLSCITCKFMFFLLSAIGIPFLFEVEALLRLWLGYVPEHAVLFCSMVMLASLADSLTVGLGHVNQAIGNIARYTLVVNTPKLLTLIPVYLFLWQGCELRSCAAVYVALEFVSAVVRLPLIHATAGLKPSVFLRQVTAMEVLPALTCILTCYLLTGALHFPFRFVLTFAVSISVYALAVYALGLTSYERCVITDICRRPFRRRDLHALTQ